LLTAERNGDEHGIEPLVAVEKVCPKTYVTCLGEVN